MLCVACPSDPDVPCWETQHIAFVVVALIGLCFYSICVPVVWMRVMQRATTSNRLRCVLLCLASPEDAECGDGLSFAMVPLSLLGAARMQWRDDCLTGPCLVDV